MTEDEKDTKTKTPLNKSKLKDVLCTWHRVFDGNFNISCVEWTGQRANGQFKGKHIGAKWEFVYCPYCGREINATSA